MYFLLEALRKTSYAMLTFMAMAAPNVVLPLSIFTVGSFARSTNVQVMFKSEWVVGCENEEKR